MPAYFIPARSSRHRAACFALYRAFLRQIPRIPLPPDIVSSPASQNPLQTLAREVFARNRHDHSPRLVISALQNGYKFLPVLIAARVTSSPEYASVLALLREHQATVLARQEKAATRALKIFPVRGPEFKPLLRKLPPLPGTNAPRYEATTRPLPLSQLKGGVRKVPVLEDGAGVPFLRISKPQPPIISRVINLKRREKEKRVETLIRLKEDDLAEAKIEDNWEQMLAGLGLHEERSNEASYTDSTRRAIKHVQEEIDEEELDRVARGKALWKLVEEEQALADQEAKEAQKVGKAKTAKTAKEMRLKRRKAVAGNEPQAHDKMDSVLSNT